MSTRILLWSILSCILCGRVAAQPAAPELEATPKAPADRAATELSYTQVSRRVTELADTLSFVESLELDVVQNRTVLQEESPPPLDARVRELTSALARLAAVPDETVLTTNDGALAAVMRAHRDLTFAMDGPSCCNWPFDEATLGPDQRRAFYELIPPRLRVPRFGNPGPPSVVPVLDSLEQRSIDWERPKAEVEEMISSAMKQADGLDAANLAQQRQERRQEELGKLSEVEKAVKAKRKVLEGELQSSEREQAKLLAALEGREKEALSETFTSVYAMMVLLALMFVMVVLARYGLARYGRRDKVINDRTLIEFGGMSFILLTIIILGNRDKIEAQTLGALLGTVAGYVFGRGAAALPTDGNDGKDDAVDKNKPLPPASTQGS